MAVAAGLALVSALASGSACAGQLPATSTPEAQIKAGIVFNLAQVVSWPDSAATTTAFGIGVIGHDDSDPALFSLANKTVRGRGLALRDTLSPAAFGEVQIVYISRSQATSLGSLLATLAGRPVLTVSELDGFCEQGGMVQMRRERNRVQLRVNREAAERAGLRLSSQLLKVAEIVKGGD
jgi:hypothetical protein